MCVHKFYLTGRKYKSRRPKNTPKFDLIKHTWTPKFSYIMLNDIM